MPAMLSRIFVIMDISSNAPSQDDTVRGPLATLEYKRNGAEMQSFLLTLYGQ
jgi:hypothetical protein